MILDYHFVIGGIIMKKFTKWAIGIIALLFIIGSCMRGGDDSTNNTVSKEQKPKQYIEVSIDTLLSETKANAAKAKQDYNNKDLKITGGTVRNIDSDSKYFTIEGSNQWDLMSIHVTPRNEAQKKNFVNLKKDTPITVYGTVSDVGDIMGITIKLDNFEQ